MRKSIVSCEHISHITVCGRCQWEFLCTLLFAGKLLDALETVNCYKHVFKSQIAVHAIS